MGRCPLTHFSLYAFFADAEQKIPASVQETSDVLSMGIFAKMSIENTLVFYGILKIEYELYARFV